MRDRLLGSVRIVITVGLAGFMAACGSSTTPTPTVSSVTVTGSAPAIGATSQFAAMAALSDGTTQDVTPQATWVSSNTADATVSSTGLVAGIAAGGVSVSATYQSVTGSESIVVGP